MDNKYLISDVYDKLVDNAEINNLAHKEFNWRDTEYMYVDEDKKYIYIEYKDKAYKLILKETEKEY